MQQKIEFDGLPFGVSIKIGDVVLLGTQSDTPDKEEKESA